MRRFFRRAEEGVLIPECVFHEVIPLMAGNKLRNFAQKRRVGELIFYCCLIALPLLQFVIMYVVVNINSILLAFKKYDVKLDGSATVAWVGLANFKKFAREIFQTEMLVRLKNSLIVYGCSLFVGTVLALLFSYYIYKSYRASGFFRYMLMMPSFMSPVVMVLIFNYVIEYALPGIFHIQSLFDGPPLQKLMVVTLYNTLIGFGSGVLMYSNAMSRVPIGLIEYGKLEGITPLREFVSVILPLIYPTLETFLIIGIAAIFTNQANLFTFYGENAPYSIQTIGYWLYKEVFTGKSSMAQFPYLSAAGLVLTAITIPVVMTARHFLNKLDKGVEF